jgi:two-component system, OmpR family, sensor histidine kinase YxdK
MRLFMREHLPLIGIQLLQFTLVILIFWLDGYRNLPTALYSLFIGMVGLTGYLLYRYFSHRGYYRRLSAPLETMEAVIQNSCNTPIGVSLDRLLKEQYRHYHSRLQTFEQKRSEHQTFINQWVHQMKTPLSIIQLTVQDHDGPAFDSIREEADRIEKGLETVLYTARLETFEHDFRVEPVRLKQMADMAVHENKRMFIRHYVYPEVIVDEALTVESDAKWLLFAINQLIINAVKYSLKNGKVTVSAYIEVEEAILVIRDRGVGIPAHDLKRVFQPFYTGDNGRAYRESTGMGLYLVQEICQKLGHRVEIRSMPGEGTEVRLIFSSRLPNLTAL